MVLLRMLLAEDPGEMLPDPYSSPYLFTAYVAAAVFLGCFAGMCSGLTLGLLSMSQVDLEVMRRTGTEHEKKCAERIVLVVANQHLLLVTLLLCNAFAAEALPLVIDRLANPIVAIILSMSVLLIMGEIVPQAVCKHNALEIGAAFTPLVRCLIFVCMPISWPIAKILDLILGEGHTAMFRRAQLEEFVDIHGANEGLGGELSETEIGIIKGALKFSEKVAKEAMTPLSKVFSLSSHTLLSKETFHNILCSGHSRIPIYNGQDQTDIIGVILVKELVGINPADMIPITNVTLRSEDTPMYDMLELFESGRCHMALLMRNLPVNSTVSREDSRRRMIPTKSHAKLLNSGCSASLPAQRRKKKGEENQEVDASTMQSAWAVVQDVPPEPPSMAQEEDPQGVMEPSASGILTIEDCIEELIGDEIIDETDRYVDNDQRQRVTAAHLVTRLPVRLRSDFLKHFVPRQTTSNAGEALIRGTMDNQQTFQASTFRGLLRTISTGSAHGSAINSSPASGPAQQSGSDPTLIQPLMGTG